MERRRLQAKRHYYQNRASILQKLRAKRLEKNPNAKKYKEYKRLKQFTEPEREKLRKRRGYLNPIIHHYPKHRKQMKKMYSDGFVV